MPDAGDARVVAHIYLSTTSNAMAEERKWEGKYCLDQYYRPPDEAEVARKMVGLNSLSVLSAHLLFSNSPNTDQCS